MYVYVCVCVCVCVGRNESLCVKGETGRMFTGTVVDVWRERRRGKGEGRAERRK